MIETNKVWKPLLLLSLKGPGRKNVAMAWKAAATEEGPQSARAEIRWKGEREYIA